ncbi:DNA polymerase/3'-5' exonuclease PolX [Heyndrickxia acidicola]|uniref:DNA-directed DNA polymerase n=1 Tax=Heyndrickxia acidicola TaxID=209389 RepID=A0ABU6MNR1_9BACI|nr:DNA polymerase/3'-5' exonuclease PolX [Heyndrickxia acidicola]MED1204857.1 DNA polymerase/3'-5' exonuclease PolX [Heyndrickxia acidicola]
MKVNKKMVIKLLEQIAIYMELKAEGPFKVAAYRKAASALEFDNRSLEEIHELTDIQGIGKGTAAIIMEYKETGKSELLEQLQDEVPKGLIPLLQIQGLGAKKIAKLHKELGVVDVHTLTEVCLEGKVRALKGFGEKTEEKILASIEAYGKRPERFPIAYMKKHALALENQLVHMEGIEQFSRAGSLRRYSETMKDLDYVISTNDPSLVKKQLLQLNEAAEAIASGDTKVSITISGEFDISVDFRLVSPDEYATALHHFTGSKDHNVKMRQLAKDRGEKISEYGVEKLETGEVLTFHSEEDFYNHFGLPFIPPEIRKDGREVEEYKQGMELVRLEDIQGDLHMHTTWSDGGHSLEEMVQACRQKGYKYMAITDHSQYLKVANGLDAKRLLRQNEEIQRLNEKYDDILILSGIEMDILPDGSLDFDDEVLAQLDIVIASIHSSFSQSQEKIMDRLKTAMDNPHVDIIAHPTGRLIGGRPGYQADMDTLIKWAKETNTALELNASPSRLDLSAENVRKAQENGVRIVINTDAHEIEQLQNMEYGIGTARRGWIEKKNVLNAMDQEGLISFLNRHHTE